MSKIKVTVTYEETKTSHIDALLQAYEAASNLANETKRELTPIIQEVGLAKHNAIMKQLEPIMDGMKKLAILKDKSGCENKNVSIKAYYKHPCVDDRRFIIKYLFNTNEFKILYCVSGWNECGEDFKKSSSDTYGLMYSADRGIVTHWNKLDIVDKLNKSLEEEIKIMTQHSISTTNCIKKQLNSLIAD